jgi:hypothetical protein
MYSELKFINKIYLEKSIGSGFVTDLERRHSEGRSKADNFGTLKA